MRATCHARSVIKVKKISGRHLYFSEREVPVGDGELVELVRVGLKVEGHDLARAHAESEEDTEI